MSNYLGTVLQFYPNDIRQVKPIGELTLYDWLYSIKHPKENIMQLFKDIEQASAVGDLKRKAELKSKLYYIVPASISDGKGRSYSNVIGFTGVAMLDFDGLEHEYAKELKEFIFTYPYVIASFLSASKKGVKAILKIPKVNSVEEYKSVYNGILSEFQFFKGIDISALNSVLASYITYDHELLYRTTATEFNGLGIRLGGLEEVCLHDFEPLEDVDPKDLEGIKLMVKRMIDNIDIEQVGHLPVRSVSLLIGGWIKYGYLSYDDAVDYLFGCMESSTYLQKGMRGYKKTAVEMIKNGMLSPLKYNRNERN